ncbi:hypothetical protein HELRODRAFT_183331 [Helobdella robusta]|uniref:Ig-like domain-containing protein n=1 Tax=Helobdella robusta TaxID=6412 RepID=T1FJH0_HELRO|nr:hypothetical protein HELRODRAFT_183331 [Helobdella robusta]ESO11318.1 hypothetical protein HELRODRAFT_183331 [Helobdella robusta]
MNYDDDDQPVYDTRVFPYINCLFVLLLKNNSIVVKCQATADPPADIYITFPDNQSLLQPRSHGKKTITVTHVESIERDKPVSGKYECQAINNDGKSEVLEKCAIDAVVKKGLPARSQKDFHLEFSARHFNIR